MKKTQIFKNFKPVNASEKPGVDNLKSCHKEITKLRAKVNPRDYQCIAIDDYIIIEGNYHPDGVVTYKIPRKKVDYKIDKFPKDFQEQVKSLQEEFHLTKKQVKELLNTVTSLNNKIDDLSKKLEILRDKAKQIKDEDNKQKYLDSFYKSYDKFYESLSSELSNYNSETKTEIKERLIQLVHLIEDTIEKCLN
jgi:chromosome segregation ATPase